MENYTETQFLEILDFKIDLACEYAFCDDFDSIIEASIELESIIKLIQERKEYLKQNQIH